MPRVAPSVQNSRNPGQPTTAGSSNQRGRSGRQAVPVAAQAADALQRLKQAQQASDDGQYVSALEGYTAVVSMYPELALTEYARLGRAMMLYQVSHGSAVNDQQHGTMLKP